MGSEWIVALRDKGQPWAVIRVFDDEEKAQAFFDSVRGYWDDQLMAKVTTSARNQRSGTG